MVDGLCNYVSAFVFDAFELIVFVINTGPKIGCIYGPGIDETDYKCSFLYCKRAQSSEQNSPLVEASCQRTGGQMT